jgi:hypothetical protein
VAHPFSRMVAVANRFAELTNPTPGAYGETPDRAIAQILKEAGSLHDPMYARLFAKALGVFPIGCLVRLSDMSVGVVSDSSDDPLAPVVRVVYDSAGLEVDEPTELALSDSDLKIVEVIDQDSLNTDVAYQSASLLQDHSRAKRLHLEFNLLDASTKTQREPLIVKDGVRVAMEEHEYVPRQERPDVALHEPCDRGP